MISRSKFLVPTPSEPSQVHERFFESESRKVKICAAAAPIITSTSQGVLRLERELDPHGPCFENAGLWRKGGGEVQQLISKGGSVIG